MSYKVLYRKYRPKQFGDIVGQDNIIKILKNSILCNKISHAFLFSGPRGTGKTSTAKVFAKAINCISDSNQPCEKCDACIMFDENQDIIEIDAASNNGVDEIREIRNNVRVAGSSKYKIYIIDEVHMLSQGAFNALLKTLEEPPSNVVFILATTDIQKVPITVLSRCMKLEFKTIEPDVITTKLKRICKEENISIDEESIKEISLLSEGCMRDALSILEQLLSQNINIDLDCLKNSLGIVSSKDLNNIVNYIENEDNNKIIEFLENCRKLGISSVYLNNSIITEINKKIRALIVNEESCSKISYLKGILEKLIFNSNLRNENNMYISLELALISPKIISREIILEDNTMNNKKDFISREIISDNIQKIDKEKDVIISREIISKYKKIMDIRINNCFVNAKKQYLTDMKDKLEEIIDLVKIKNKKIANILIDIDICAASDSICIFGVDSNTNFELLLEKISVIESVIKQIVGEYKIAILLKSDWEHIKKEYVNNLKNKIKYNFINEPDIIIEENKTKTESLAYEIFNEEKIEIN